MKLTLLICCIMTSHLAFAQLEKRLDSVISEYVGAKEPGIALSIESEGKILYKKGFGLTAVDGKKLNANTNFRLASVSKQFTAMCILLLEKEGKLSFEDPIIRFLPELPAVTGNKIKIRHLITHSSGIPDYESLMEHTEAQVLDADVLKLIKDQDSTYFEPGSRFRYSNTAYALLAIITERVSGKSFAQFMRENIFIPLKMTRSSVYEATAYIRNRSFGFAPDRNGKLCPNDQSSTSAVKGDGGVYTSLNDYRKWTHALWDGTLLDLPIAFARLNFPIKEVTGSFYGPGWFYFSENAPSYFHSGSTCGFSSFSINIPGKKTSIVYFSNIAGNTEAFKKILEVLSTEGIDYPTKIFELHELTR